MWLKQVGGREWSGDRRQVGNRNERRVDSLSLTLSLLLGELH